MNGLIEQLETLVFSRYDSLGDYVNDATAWTGALNDENGSGCYSLNQAKERAAKIDDAAIDSILSMEAQLRDEVELPSLRDHRRRTRFTEDSGDELDLDRLRAGQAYWRRAQREESTGSTEVTIMADISTPASVHNENLFWRGAIAVALAKLLEDKGYSVELWLVNRTHRLYYNDAVRDPATHYAKEYGQLNAILVKGKGQLLDLPSLANAVNGWFYRSLVFASRLSMAKHLGLRCDSSYGCTRIFEPQLLDLVSRDTNRIFIGGIWNRDEAIHRVKQELGRFQ